MAGTVGGLVWSRYGWSGVVAFVGGFLTLALVFAGLLARLSTAPALAGEAA